MTPDTGRSRCCSKARHQGTSWTPSPSSTIANRPRDLRHTLATDADRWGVSWQITPRVLTEALAAGGDEAKRAFNAMMGMKKLDVAAIKAARLMFTKQLPG